MKSHAKGITIYQCKKQYITYLFQIILGNKLIILNEYIHISGY